MKPRRIFRSFLLALLATNLGACCYHGGYCGNWGYHWYVPAHHHHHCR